MYFHWLLWINTSNTCATKQKLYPSFYGTYNFVPLIKCTYLLSTNSDVEQHGLNFFSEIAFSVRPSADEHETRLSVKYGCNSVVLSPRA